MKCLLLQKIVVEVLMLMAQLCLREVQSNECNRSGKINVDFGGQEFAILDWTSVQWSICMQQNN